MRVNPRVTVVITCYNYGEYLQEAIDSVLAQTYRGVDLIVIDDGSTDNSSEVAQGYGSKLRYIYQDNAGVISARNRGIEEAKGEYLIFLDADDKLVDNYIEDLVVCAQQNKADIVYTDVRRFEMADDTSDFPEYSIEILKNRNFIHASSLVRRAIIGEVRFDQDMSSLTHEDWDFFLSLCLKGAIAQKCSSTFLYYRIHGVSRNNVRQTLAEKRRYIDTYRYIVTKHSKEYRKEFEYLSGVAFSEWYAELDDELSATRQNLASEQNPGTKVAVKKILVAVKKRTKRGTGRI